MPVEENKEGILTGPLIYVSGLTIVRNPYSGKIKPNEFCKRREQAKQSSNKIQGRG